MYSMCLIILFRYNAYYCPLIKTPFTVYHVTTQSGLECCQPHNVVSSVVILILCYRAVSRHTDVSRQPPDKDWINKEHGDWGFFVNILIII